MLLAEVLRATGRYADARREVEPVVARQPNARRARYVLGLLYRDVGDPRADAEWKKFLQEFDGNKLDLNDPPTLFYLAEAARYTADFEFANGTYREAVDRDKTLHEANVEWGYLFLDKYAPADAEQSFDEVLKVDPRHPDAHAGMAAVKLEPSYDLAAATAHLDRALEVNPRHVPSLLLRAGIEIDQNQWQKAAATLNEVFAVNPQELEARSLLATIHWLRDDTRAYEAEKKKVFAVNPAYARFYHIVARSAVREHRYREAIELERQAVTLRPTYFEAMEAIGAGYLRLGMEKEGLEWLRKAWKGDQYNMRTKNTLDLFEDFIPREYSFATTKSFKIRYHNDEKPLYRRYIEPLLEQAFGEMVKRYGYQPKTPVVIELFQNADHYSVRTIGLPNLGALGICFGQVITAMSPSVGDINWAMVLWHELSHVFAIQLSNSRVPRWFTEGLSEYETVLARPEWRRENDADVYAAMADGVLPSIAELNYGFMKPNMQEVVVAYHLSSLAIEYLARTYGFPKIVAALKAYGQGLETPAVLEQMTGKKIAALDADFRKYLEVRLAPYKGTFVVPTLRRDLKELAKIAAASPKDPHAHSRLALGPLRGGRGPAGGRRGRPRAQARSAQPARALRQGGAGLARGRPRRRRGRLPGAHRGRRRQLRHPLAPGPHRQQQGGHRDGREAPVHGQEARPGARLSVPGAVRALHEERAQGAGAARAGDLRDRSSRCSSARPRSWSRSTARSRNGTRCARSASRPSRSTRPTPRCCSRWARPTSRPATPTARSSRSTARSWSSPRCAAPASPTSAAPAPSRPRTTARPPSRRSTRPCASSATTPTPRPSRRSCAAAEPARRSADPAGVEEQAHRLDDLAQAHRLAEEQVGAGGEGDLLGHRAAGRDRDDRQVAHARVGAQLADDRGAVQHRQVDVDDGGVEALGAAQLERLAPVGRLAEVEHDAGAELGRRSWPGPRG